MAVYKNEQERLHCSCWSNRFKAVFEEVWEEPITCDRIKEFQASEYWSKWPSGGAVEVKKNIREWFRSQNPIWCE